MPTRRQIVQAGVALAVSSGISTLGQAADGQQAPLADEANRLPLYRVVFDERHEASRLFGAHAQQLGAALAPIDGSVHELWQDQLYPRWRESSIAIAGMSTHQALFSLDMMARDAGMQTVYRAHHRVTDGTVRHELYGARELLASEHWLSADAPSWSRQSARWLTSWPRTWTRLSREHSTIAGAQRHAVSHDTLISWVIAPVRKQRIYA